MIVDAVCLYGTPTQTGFYEAKLLVEMEDGKKETRTATIVIVSEPFSQTGQAAVVDAGKEKTVKFTDGHTGTVFKAELKSGSVPPGMVFLSGGGALRYFGAPSQTGTFTAVWRIILTSGEVIEHTISVTVPSRFEETSESISARKGAEGTVFLTFDGADQVSCAEQIGGQLPPGMTFGFSMSEKPHFSGKPTENGTWKAVFRFFLLDGTLLTHTVIASVYSDAPSIDVYTMDLSLGESIVPKSDHDKWLDRTIACAVNPGNQVKMNVDPSTGEIRLDLDHNGTWDVSVTRESGSAVYSLLPESSLTGDYYVLTLNQDALDRADKWGTEDPSAQYAREIRFHIYTEYDLFITGTQVNSKNRKDIRGDGIFSFDGVDTLVIRGDCSYYGSSPLIQNGINGLTVRTEEDSVLSSWNSCIETKGSLSLTGPGKLALNSQNGSAVVCEKALLDIYSTTMTVQAKKKGIEGTGSGAVHARLRKADVTISSGEGAMDGFWSIGMTNCMVTQPARGHKGIIGSLTCLVNENNELLTDARISAYEKKYDLLIDGIQVTDVNREDVLGNGIFFFDGERTLYVSGSYEGASNTIIENSIQGLTIEAAPGSVLRTKAMSCLILRENTLLTGGPLTAVSESKHGNGISFDEDVWLAVSDASLTVQGARFGIRGAADSRGLAVRSSDVTVSGATAIQVPGGSYNSAINSFAGGIELIGCEIVSPTGGAIKDGSIVSGDGTAAHEVLIRVTVKAEAVGSRLNYSVNLTGGSARLVAAWYDAEGRMLGCSVKNETLDGLKTGTMTVKKGQKEYRLFILDKNGSPLTLPWSSGE